MIKKKNNNNIKMNNINKAPFSRNKTRSFNK